MKLCRTGEKFHLFFRFLNQNCIHLMALNSPNPYKKIFNNLSEIEKKPSEIELDVALIRF